MAGGGATAGAVGAAAFVHFARRWRVGGHFSLVRRRRCCVANLRDGASWRDGDTAPRAARFPPHLARALPPGRHARHARRAWAQHGWGGEGGARACSFEGRAGCGRGCGWTIRTPQAHFGAVVVCRLLGATTGERAHRLRHLRRRRRRRRRVPRHPAVRRWRRRAASRLGAAGEQRGQAEPLRCCCS
uniref:Uncharacterized protein n=1 Tax=Emiliania huxleyi (strain CCMP1516) TaxID=280463 RepID=A0A0D3KZ73_EMIH1